MAPVAYYGDIAVLTFTVLSILAMLAGAYGWYRGKLPLWVGGLVKWQNDAGETVSLPDLERTVCETRQMTHRLEQQHMEVAQDLHDVKVAQVDIATAVNDPEATVPIGKLERMHFKGEGPRKGEFVEGDYSGYDD
jgi:hypothetical protein